MRNGDESDVDCGGACSGCLDGLRCNLPSDCASRACAGGTCRVPGCADGVVNGDESDTDCGGSCDPCAGGAMCRDSGDCASGTCTAGVCAAAADCGDGVRNGDETDTDCGGSCPACAAGRMCSAASDCESGVCGAAGSCTAPACDDGVQNGSETDTDCGGGCPGCAAGGACSADSDCATGTCTGGMCASPPSVTVEFPSATSTACSFGSCAAVGTGGGGRYYRTGDYVEQAYAGTGLTSVTRLDVMFDMDDLTSGCAVGQPLSWNVLVNGTIVGTYGYTGGSSMGRFTTTRSYTFAAVAGVGPGSQYTLRFEATTTVCPGGSSWSWFPGGSATLTR